MQEYCVSETKKTNKKKPKKKKTPKETHFGGTSCFTSKLREPFALKRLVHTTKAKMSNESWMSSTKDLFYYLQYSFVISCLLWPPERVTNENANTDIR